MIWKKRNEGKTLEQVILTNLGLTSQAQFKYWYTKSHEDKYHIENLSCAAEEIRKWDGPIYVMGDYDVDGITSTCILYLVLKDIGKTDVHYRLPHRFSEGYGMKTSMIDEITGDNALVLTCDNGITAHEAVSAAKERGFKVIITDHHQPKIDTDGVIDLPDADLIVDPTAIAGKRDFTKYCGAGLAFKLAKQLTASKDLLSYCNVLAAIGTIADSVELREENHVIAHEGLKLLNEGHYRTGLDALLKQLGIIPSTSSPIDEETIGFKIAPCLNAPGRLLDTGAEISLTLLLEDDPFQSASLAEEITVLNERRKNQVSAGEVIVNQLADPDKWPIVINCNGISEGVIGILASRLVDTYQKPVFVFTETEDGILKGSGRSIDGFDLKQYLDECQLLLLSYGGHSGAAGLTMTKESYESNKAIMEKIGEKYKDGYEVDNTRFYDWTCSDQEACSLARGFGFDYYAPYGNGNPHPVFKVEDYHPIRTNGHYVQMIGSDGSTLKMNSPWLTALGFHFGERISDEACSLTLYGKLSLNRFNGRVSSQIILDDLENEISKCVVDDEAFSDFFNTITRKN